jgi:hypothetical protein
MVLVHDDDLKPFVWIYDSTVSRSLGQCHAVRHCVVNCIDIVLLLATKLSPTRCIAKPPPKAQARTPPRSDWCALSVLRHSGSHSRGAHPKDLPKVRDSTSAGTEFALVATLTNCFDKECKEERESHLFRGRILATSESR